MSILTDLVGLTKDSTSDDPLIQAWKMIKGQQQDDPANAQPVTHKVTYNPDGSQDHTVNASVAKPVAPGSDYDAYIAQQESGANPNIGYHDPSKSSAYGTYGITAPAYQDVQAANPAFAGKDITSLSPEEQRAANDVLKAQYAQQLTAKGVDPTEANLRLAHLLGAGGAHQYLTQGTFNQAAMDANGGPEQLQKIAQQRLASAGGQPQQAQGQPPGGQPQQQPQNPILGAASKVLNAVIPSAEAAPMPPQAQQQSGPVAPGQTTQDVSARPGETIQQVEQAGPPTSAMGPDAWVTRFATAQQDPKMVAQIAYDPNAPKWVREMAEQNLGTHIQNKREQQTAEQLVNQSVQSGDMKPLAGAMNSQDGSWVKYYLFNRLGLGSAAQNEANKLGLMDKTVQAMGPNGEYGLLKMNGRGEPVGGVRADGTPLTTAEALDWASRGAANSQVIRTANTQAVAAYKSEQGRLQKEADTLLGSGVPPEVLQQYGLDPASIEKRSRAAGGNVRNAALEGYGMNSNAAPGGPVGSPAAQTTGGAAPAAGSAKPAVETGPVMYPTETGRPSILENWNRPKEGEGATALGNRLKNSSPEEIESAAQSLATGAAKPADFTGRDSNFRRYALQRAMEINPGYNTGTYAIVQSKVKDVTSGKTSQTLSNMGTAVDHALEYKELLNQIPATNVSSWNAFIQGVSKYGNAPEVKSKEALAGFLAGELTKAATGTGGGVGERELLAKQIQAANTPAEVRKIIDTQLALGHARYDNIRRNYEGTTKRNDFKEISPMSDSAAAEYERLDKNAGAKEWLKKNPNDPRAAEVKKKLGL